MAITLAVAGVDRTDYLKLNSGKIRGQMGERWFFDGVFEDLGRGWVPVLGSEIVVSEGAARRFAGFIMESRTIWHPGTDGKMQYALRCSDYNVICDRRLVNARYENESLHNIVSHINDNFLSGEGITLGGVTNPGPTIVSSVSFAYETVTSAFNKLSTLTGYLWYIDQDKDLTFATLSSNPAPITITDSSANWFDLSVRRTLYDYRNRQFERTEYAVSATVTETFTGDGSTRSFFVSQPMGATPTVTVNGVAKTVGRLGLDGPPGAFQWYYDVGGVGVHNFAPEPAVPGGQSLVVVYQSIGQNVTMVEDPVEIAARAAIEGGSGKHEAIEEQRNIDSLDTLQDLATGRLRQYGAVATHVELGTREPGILPGMRLTINSATHGINAAFLVQGVDYSWVGAKRGDFFECRLDCTDKEPEGRAAAFFERVVEMARIGPDPVTVVQSTPTSVPYSASHYIQRVELTSSQQISSPATPVDKDRLTVILDQDATGGRQITWASGYHSSTPVNISMRPSKRTILDFVGYGSQWHVVAFQTGVTQ